MMALKAILRQLIAPKAVAAHTCQKLGSFNFLLTNSPGAAGCCQGPPALFV